MIIIIIYLEIKFYKLDHIFTVYILEENKLKMSIGLNKNGFNYQVLIYLNMII